MILNRLLTAASFTPNSLQFPNAWVGHLPFAAWVIQEVSPRLFVELGTHSGNSYFSFCQSVVEAGISSKCYAVDTWQGDEHAGQYNDQIFAKVNAHHQEHYAGFSRLMRMTFDDAATYFADESIELLHIDGLHTYEAVRHDFETWLPKLAPGAVVMFHDTNVRERNFGVWKLWEELQANYPNNLEFVQSHGLGVLQLNSATGDKKLEWLQPGSPEKKRLINYFAALGLRQLERFELDELRGEASNFNQSILERDKKIGAYHRTVLGRDEQIACLNHAVAERDEQIACLNHAVAERDEQIASLNHAVAERDEQIACLNHVVAERDEQIACLNHVVVERDSVISLILASTSWRMTAPLRAVKSFFLSNGDCVHIQKSQPKKFDADWYVGQNPDVAMSGMDPYEHYQCFGRAEGRQPAPDTALSHDMNSAEFVIRIALRSIKQRSIKVIKFLYQHLPLTQDLKNRIREFCYRRLSIVFRGVPSYEFWLARRATGTKVFSGKNEFVPEGVDWNLMLPVTVAESAQSSVPLSVVDVIVPVYRGLDQTLRCINSVLNSTVKTPFRLIVINDASPDDELIEYLRDLSTTEKIVFVENAENFGFTATVNRGMKWSDKNDVVLLNSDAEVANDWLDKLKAHAYSGSRISSVTPFSNNATICNYPTLDGLKKLPDGESVRSLDMAFSSANKGRNIDIPTAVGFCMYIRRDCLNDVGLFDVETFGKGYGEENDFCLRATARGWKHLLAADTFVFHEGEVSFQTGSNPRKERAGNILRERYPKYEADVARHVGENRAYPLRIAATAARFRQGNLPVVLHVLHAHGGGTEKHVEELCRNLYGKAKLLIMTPPFVESGKSALQLRSADPVDSLDVHLPASNFDFLVSLIQSFGVSLVHIHHLLGYSFDLRHLVEKLEVPFYLTMHDYMLICPRVNLMPVGKNYCGEPEPSKCNNCLSIDYPHGASDIVWWREGHAWLFNDALAVICPSCDVAQRCRRYFPTADYRVVAHEKTLSDDHFYIDVPVLDKDEPLRVAILGVLARHKGIELISEALLIAQRIGAPLQFHLIGYAESNLPFVPSTLFSQTGHYEDTELAGKINTFNPHLILFPAASPETYSYTLTAALKSKRSVMASNFGAFPERVALRPWTWLIDWNISAAQLVEKLCEVRVNNFYTRMAPVIPRGIEFDVSISVEDCGFYEGDYLAAGNDVRVKGVVDIRVPGKITALVMIEDLGAQPSPCAYIRLILPLIRERGEKFELRWVTSENVMSYVADVLICQRTAVTSRFDIDRISAHCRKNNIRIVYDIDDLLLTLPEDHPEHEIYKPKSAAVLRWLLEADEVWVSTEALQHHVFQINPRTHVVPNYIDETLWVRPKTSEVKRDQKDQPVRLLYMGTQTHAADFELVKKVLKRLKNEFSERIEMNLIGISPNASSEKWYRTINPPQAIGSGYPAFVNWICNEPTFDIGIAPLVDNEFNRCKSAIKFLDYSALGLATVASDLNGYKFIINGVNGFRVNNTEESWYETLKTLIVNPDIRSKIQLTAHDDIIDKYSYGSVAGYRTKRLTCLLSEDTNRSDNVSTLV